ncbi:MAG TPA: polysaccharide deacetylase family protein [Rhodocyclaceae bacterium]|jgi:hypothetical protein
MTIVVQIPGGGWQAEKRYVAECVLRNFLGIKDFSLCVGEPDEWVLFDSSIGDTALRLRLPNLFFPEEKPAIYLTQLHLDAWGVRSQTLPAVMIGIQGYPADDIPLVFVRQECRNVSDIDLFGTIFFYLTRYEEYVLGSGDELDRFVSHQSVVRAFHARPVADEYVWLIRYLLERKLPGILLAQPEYSLEVSHDVDIPHSWVGANAGTLVRTVARRLLKEASLRGAVRSLRSYWNTSHDPAYCFDWMMDKTEALGLQATYYFLVGGTHPLDVNYEISAKPIATLLDSVATRGHAIGLHGSIESAYDESLMRTEVQALEAATGYLVHKVRQHYLRFSVPTTWRIIEAAGLTDDATLGFADRAGFRCGSARRFPVFDVCTAASIPVFETPLICMEHSLLDPAYQGLAPDQAYEYSTRLVDQVKAYGGNFSLLWHNHNLVTEVQRDLFQQILKYAS